MATFSFGKKDVVNAPDVSSIIADAVKRVDKVAQILLLSGFEFEIDGIKYHFSYQAENQTNFNNYAASAALSLQLGNTDTASLIKTYGANSDGSLDTSKLPAELPSEWYAFINGHHDGTVENLKLDINTFLALNAAAHDHHANTLNKYRDIKADLYTSVSEEDVKNKLAEIKIEDLEHVASEAEQTYL